MVKRYRVLEAILKYKYIMITASIGLLIFIGIRIFIKNDKIQNTSSEPIIKDKTNLISNEDKKIDSQDKIVAPQEKAKLVLENKIN